MKVLLAGNKERGLSCLASLRVEHDVVGIIGNITQNSHFIDEAKKVGCKVFQPQDINDKGLIKSIKAIAPDIIILSGYSQIVKKDFISIAQHGCINLHAGKLPEYRGSSPLNWALINGENSFTLSIIQVDEGIDTGNVLIEKEFHIDINDQISNLQETANKQFPRLLNKVLNQIEKNTLKPKAQDNQISSYYPLRFPEDGLIFFDELTANEIHNRVRALSLDNLGVSTFLCNKKVTVFMSSLTKRPFYGESGRIYSISSEKGILVCAKDRCLWLNKIVDSLTGEDLTKFFNRYDKLATIKEATKNSYEKSKIKTTILRDQWLSMQIGKSVYQLICDDFSKDDFSEIWEKFRLENATENYLVFSKIDTQFSINSDCLEKADFKLIDTNLTFKSINSNFDEIQDQNNIEICFSEKKHQKAIEKIARDNFSYSRFHLDEKIDNDIASKIKQNWVKNYYFGNRGDAMIIAMIDNQPIGFLQLLIKETELFIDLIAVDKVAQGKGVASSMIKFANKKINRPIILVGTQISNIPSTKLYKKLGFILTESQSVYHFHS